MKPAGIIRRAIGGILPPKRLDAKVYAEPGPDGRTVIFRTRFFIDGEPLPETCQVSSSFIRYLGYRLEHSESARAALHYFAAAEIALPPEKAVVVLRDLKRRLTKVRNVNGEEFVIQEGHILAKIISLGDNKAEVVARVKTELGEVPERLPDVDATAIITQNALITIPDLPLNIRKSLLRVSGPRIIEGDDIASLIQAIQKKPGLLKWISLPPEWEASAVIDSKPKRRVIVDGNREYVTLKESLIFAEGTDEEVAIPVASVREERTSGRQFTPIAGGWVDLKNVSSTQLDPLSVTEGNRIEGPEIPKILDELRRRGNDMDTLISPEVATEHRIRAPNGSGHATVSANSGRLKIQNSANCTDGSTVPLEDLQAARDNGETYQRSDNAWIEIDPETIRKTEVAISGGAVDSLPSGVWSEYDIPLRLEEAIASQRRGGSITIDQSVDDHHHLHPQSQSTAVFVTGDENEITARPELIYNEHIKVPLEEAQSQIRRGLGHIRVPNGWAALDEHAIHSACESAQRIKPGLENGITVTGSDIPDLLSSLNGRSHWHVYLSEQVAGSHRVVEEKPHWRFHFGTYQDESGSGLTLSSQYDQARFKLDAEQVLEAVRNGQRWLKRGDTWLLLDQKGAKTLNGELNNGTLKKAEKGWRFPARDRDRILEIFSRLGTVEHSESYRQFLMKLEEFQRIEEQPRPIGMKSGIELRSYQQHGYNWLCFLEEFGLNGILADDMGLGKTLQTLAAVARIKEVRQHRRPTLVICPTSVVTNWRDEILKFFGDLYPIIYRGPEKTRKRILQDEIGRADIVISTYGLVARDIDFLNRFPWRFVILDEAHYIRNPDAERSRAIKTIPSAAKIALTGTPIQNKVDELWSLFDFLMPGFLGKRKPFLDRYGRSAKDGVSAQQVAPLRERIKPFVMRRLKIEVAKDLPDKIIIQRKAELTPIQAIHYKLMIGDENVQKMIREVNEKGVQRSQLHILQAYAALRKICNHPGLLSAKGKLPVKDSGKLASLEELLEEVADGDHRALIFCQSTEMLDVIQAHLPDWGHTHLRLDGSTPGPKRQILVDTFNSGDARCFLISTLAGGTGLNLTGADTVIFYDHDWNPANDRQAEDRAYRIGQTRNVTVYKLITEGTIEEKIIERQERKMALAESVIGVDEQGFKDITKEELLELFKSPDF